MENDVGAFETPKRHATESKNQASEITKDGKETTHPNVNVSINKNCNFAAGLVDSLDPNSHLAILSSLLRGLGNPKAFFDEHLLKYDSFINGMGRETVQKAILEALEKDVQQLFDSVDVSLETFRRCDTKKARVYKWAGVYLHVIYDSNKPHELGFYVGSADNVANRIEGHERDRWRKKFARSAHYDFWNKPGMEDFWILLGGFKGESYERSTEAILLNIFEMLGALLARSLKSDALKMYLPKNASVHFQPRATGLNMLSPLNQWRRAVDDAFMGTTALRIRRKAKSFWCLWRRGYGEKRMALVRVADPSKGDRSTIDVMCKKCRNPFSVKVDNAPLYDVKSGKYVSRLSHCRCCSTIGKSLFVPVDTSLAWRTQYSINYEVHSAHVKKPEWAKSLQERWRNGTLNIHELKGVEVIAAIRANGVKVGTYHQNLPELRKQLEALLTGRDDLQERVETAVAKHENLMKRQQMERRVRRNLREVDSKLSEGKKHETQIRPKSAKVSSQRSGAKRRNRKTRVRADEINEYQISHRSKVHKDAHKIPCKLTRQELLSAVLKKSNLDQEIEIRRDARSQGFSCLRGASKAWLLQKLEELGNGNKSPKKPFNGRLRTGKLLPPVQVERLWRRGELKLSQLSQIQIIKQI
jgi:hypothetical protein